MKSKFNPGDKFICQGILQIIDSESLGVPDCYHTHYFDSRGQKHFRFLNHNDFRIPKCPKYLLK